MEAVEPAGSLQDVGYLHALRQRGFKTGAQREADRRGRRDSIASWIWDEGINWQMR